MPRSFKLHMDQNGPSSVRHLWSHANHVNLARFLIGWQLPTHVCIRPFPSSLVPLVQNESKCETFHMEMSSAYSSIFMQIKVIFIRMISHLDSLWNRGTRELGNGLSLTRQIRVSTNTKKLVKKLARLEANSICHQQFANMFADCFCAVHTQQLEFANTSLPTLVCRVKAALDYLTNFKP